MTSSWVTPLKKGQSTNSTATSFAVADTRPTTTTPAPSATRSVIHVAGGGGFKEEATLKLIPTGGNADNDVINYKVIGWNSVQTQTGLPLIQYISRPVCEFQGTLSSALLGNAGMAMPAAEFCCDLITLTTGFAVIHLGTLGVDAAWIECDVSSYEFVEVLYDLGPGGDVANCFYGW